MSAPALRPSPTVNLETAFLGLRLENPFLLSAAPSTDDLDMARQGLDAGWAGVVLKTTSVEGTPVPLAYPMMSAMEWAGRRLVGMGNIDLISEHHIDAVEERVRILTREFPAKLIAASIMGSRKEDWQSLVWRLRDAGVHLIECSFSCPQGSMGERAGAMVAQSASATEKVAGWVKEAAEHTPVLIKITPQVADVVEIARAVKNGGADGITASNSVPALMGVDIDTFAPIPSLGGLGTYSGFTGPAIKPLTLRTVAEIARHVSIPISGNGGICTWSDAVELFAVGAQNIQICSAVMHHGFRIIDDLKSGLARYMERKGFTSVSDIVGKALPHIVDHDELPRRTLRSRIDESACLRCGVCFVACRDGGHQAIAMREDRLPVVDDERCVGCGLCPLTCPAGCIRMEIIP
ncbi:NAD-dependent dihydropyrimidine dehydrogenase subunit PreA [Candidatus Fermentibacteria bacterium]|nr:NAD-dependent dihydropyrimidine dehydrogenase subunit PreA [Candidatus Fermentibacteria bacterium]